MANSTITFYKVGFRKELSPRVDDIADYLAPIQDYYRIENFQYIRHALTLTIKIDYVQDEIKTFIYNYCEIFNDETGTDRKMYYYVDKVTQVSPKTASIELSMDTVNSLTDPREFLSSTEIIRQHGDRFVKPTYWDPAVGGKLARRVDRISEGIIVTKHKQIDQKLNTGKLYFNLNWYLIYTAGQQENSPVTVTLVPESEIQISPAGQSVDPITFTVDNFENDKYYYFLNADNFDGQFVIDSITSTLNGTRNKALKWNGAGYSKTVSEVTSCQLEYLVLHKTNNKLYYTLKWNKINEAFNSTAEYVSDSTATLYSNAKSISVGDTSATVGLIWTEIPSVTFNKASIMRVSAMNHTLNNETSSGIVALTTERLGIYVGTGVAKYLLGLSAIDRTAPNLIKIIKYPYCPINYIVNSVNPPDITFDASWELKYDADNIGRLVYKYLDLPSLQEQSIFELSVPDLDVELDPVNIGKQKSKQPTLESKQYHSDFSLYKLLYDSFSTPIKFENFELLPRIGDHVIDIEYKPSANISSNIGFKFSMPASDGRYVDESDFDRVIVSTRDNDEVLLNSSYLDYLRYGKSIDEKTNALALKQAQRQATTSTIGSIASIIGAVASFALAPATGGASAALGVGLAGSAVGNTLSTVNQWSGVSELEEKQNNAMNSKLQELLNQGASVAGCNDSDLMEWYSDNKLHFMLYSADTTTRLKLVRLFDFTGYSHPTIATPIVDGRIWYNFIQCNPAISQNDMNTYPKEWFDDLKNKYNNGVTVFHKQIIDGTATWNFDRQYENFETWIVEGV